MKQNRSVAKDSCQRTVFLIVSWTIPPNASGSAVTIKNLVQNFASDQAVILGQVPYKGRISLKGMQRHHRITIPSYTLSWRLKHFLDPLYCMPLVLFFGVRAVRRYKIRYVIGVFPNAAFFISAYLIARLERKPFFPYYHNLYVETRKNNFHAYLAVKIQQHIFRHSASLFSMSHGMSEFLMKSYRVNTIPLLHALNLPIPRFRTLQIHNAPYRIGMSGNINQTMLSPLKAVVGALRRTNDFELLLHTPMQREQVLSIIRIPDTKISVVDICDPAELVSSLSQCDVLVLGLSERKDGRREGDYQTQFPTRTLEVLLAGKPILLLCPEKYYLAQFFRQNECGFVLSSLNPDQVLRSLYRLCEDKSSSEFYVANALITARKFKGERVAKVLLDELHAHNHEMR